MADCKWLAAAPGLKPLRLPRATILVSHTLTDCSASAFRNGSRTQIVPLSAKTNPSVENLRKTTDNLKRSPRFECFAWDSYPRL